MTFRYAYAIPNLPWTPTGEDERRFERVLWSVLVPMLIVGMLIPFLPLLVEEMLKPAEPERPVTLVLTPPPRPPQPKVEGGGEQQKPSPVQPAPKPNPERTAQRAPTPKPQPAPQTVEQARQRAAQSGILSAASRELASLRNNPVITSNQGTPDLRAGPTAGVKSNSERVFAGAGSGSGGISTSGIGHSGGGGTSLGEGGTGGALNGGGGGSGHGSGGGGTGRAGTYTPKRTDIQIVFDRNKAALQNIYQRAFNQNGNLGGNLVLHLTILPSGKVSDCRVVSSELRDSELEQKIIARVSMLDFGAQDVPTWSDSYRLQFVSSN